jgi:hypothetical protein
MHDEGRRHQRRSESEADGPAEKKRLKIRIGQSAVDRGVFVLHEGGPLEQIDVAEHTKVCANMNRQIFGNRLFDE